MNVSKTRQVIRRLRRERDNLEQQLVGFRGKLVEGCLSERYTECRKGNCKCTRGQPHGPFLYMTVKGRGKPKYRYVGKTSDVPIVEGLHRYRSFQSKLEQLRKTNHELNELWNKLRKSLVKG